MMEATVEVNGVRWTTMERRTEKACSSCQKPTRGRIGKAPYCVDCGMKELMQPIKQVGELLRVLLP